jgi:protein-L-isoaspartate(D-aspartate) O-methyltransferase
MTSNFVVLAMRKHWCCVPLFALSLIISPVYHVVLSQDDQRTIERRAMVDEQIIARGIKDKATIKALLAVPRHQFVPSNQIAYAYNDRPLPIGFGQTISQPYIVAYMTELVAPNPRKKILEVGTGSGYQAAVLAATGAQVFSVEVIPELASSARQRLIQLGYKNLKILNADGYFGWPEFAPFDAIIVTAAAASIPPPLLEQLADGGKMVIPVGSPFFVQTLMQIDKKGDQFESKNLMPVRFVPFRRSE